jgi:hypothetical protein
MAGAVRPASGAWDLGAYVGNTLATPARLTLTATTPLASRVGSSRGVFTVSRSGSTAAALTVNLGIGGTAINGVDYLSLGISVTIPAGAAAATLTVTPLPSTSLVGPKTAFLALASGSGYWVGPANNATVTIGSNSLPGTLSKAPGNNIKISWASVVGKVYRVACKNSLADAAWTDLSGSVTATTTTTSYTDSSTSTKAQRYYNVYQTN